MCVCINTAPTGCICLIFDMSVEKLQIQLKLEKNYWSREYPSVFHIVDNDVCRASLAPLSEFITLLRMTFLRQQY